MNNRSYRKKGWKISFVRGRDTKRSAYIKDKRHGWFKSEFHMQELRTMNRQLHGWTAKWWRTWLPMMRAR